MLKGCSLAALLHTILINCHLMIINHHQPHTFLNNTLSKEYIIMYVLVSASCVKLVWHIICNYIHNTLAH